MTAASPGPRCVLLAGSSGTGKSTLCRLGHSQMLAAWGHPAAVIDVDHLYQAVDARWELAYTDERNAMVLGQAACWVRSLIGHGWLTVVVTGNSVFDPWDTAPFIAELPPELSVHHLTLRVREEVLLARCAGEPRRDPTALLNDLRPEGRLRHPGTAVIDSSDLDPSGTLDALVRSVMSGGGLVRGPGTP